MRKVSLPQRQNWQRDFEESHWSFHSVDGKYWLEDTTYLLTRKEFQTVMNATQHVHDLCLELIEKVLQSGDSRWFAFPDWVWSDIERSWRDKDFSLYGRFDINYNGMGTPKFYEYNADTATSILETGMAQSLWHKAIAAPLGYTAANNLEEALVQRFKEWKVHQRQSNQSDFLHLISSSVSLEDFENVQYLQRIAQKAGVHTKLEWVESIQIDHAQRKIYDADHEEIQSFFKLYPWEWMIEEDVYPAIQGCSILEPKWKMLLSNKGLWAALWHYFPECEFLIPTFLTEEEMKAHSNNYVRKPFFSREGANIQIMKEGSIIEETPGMYGEEGYIYQQFTPLPKYDNHYTLIGSWVVGNSPAGIMVREDVSLVTKDSAFFASCAVEP